MHGPLMRSIILALASGTRFFGDVVQNIMRQLLDLNLEALFLLDTFVPNTSYL